jgi:hypothetical protein
VKHATQVIEDFLRAFEHTDNHREVDALVSNSPTRFWSPGRTERER